MTLPRLHITFSNALNGARHSFLYKVKVIFLLIVLPPIIWCVLLLITKGAGRGLAAALGTVAYLIIGVWGCLRDKPERSFKRYLLLIMPALLYGILFLYICVPIASDVRLVAEDFPEAPTRYWQLPTGSRIAYYHLEPPAGVTKKAVPMIYLHGGPGGSVSESNIRFFQRLADHGYDVYLYDQAGGGRSDLLPVQEYSHQRNLDDLAAIIQIIGADEVVLIGQSYGGTMLASALTDDVIAPRISKAIFAEPGALPLDMDEMIRYVDKNVPKNGSMTAKAHQYTPSALFSPRAITAFLLPAQSQIVSQTELMNAVSPSETHKMISSAYCQWDANRVPQQSDVAVNYLADIVISNDKANNHPVFSLEKFSDSHVPAMLMLGECSYVYRRDQLAYLVAYPDITLSQYFTGVGHSLWNGLDNNNERAEASLLSFIENTTPPLPNYPTKNDLAKFVEDGK